MTVFGPHYDALRTGFAKQYCYYVKSYYRKSFIYGNVRVGDIQYHNNTRDARERRNRAH